MKTQISSARPLALSAACALAFTLGCDPDAMQRRESEAQAQDRVLMDTLQRENARIDMAAQEALASAEATAARGASVQDRPGGLREAGEAIGRAGDEALEDAERGKDEFVAGAREQLRRMRSEMQGIESRTHRRVDEIDASIEQDRQRAEEQLDRLIDESREGYVRARDAMSRELRELETRLQALRKRVEDAA